MKRATYINLYFIIHHISSLINLSLSLSLKKLIKSSNLKLDLKHLDSMLFLVYISIIYRPKRGREKGEKGKIPSRFDVVPYIPIIYIYTVQKEGKGREKLNRQTSGSRVARYQSPFQRLFNGYFRENSPPRNERGGSFIFCNRAGAPELLLALWIFPHS